MSAPQRETVERVLARHDIYGFNGSQIACQCDKGNWRGFSEHRHHVALDLADYVAAAVDAATTSPGG